MPLYPVSRLAIVSLALRYFGVVFAFAFMLGILRVLIVIPVLGHVNAVLIELPIVLALSWWVAGRLLRPRPAMHANASALIAMGAIAFGVLMLAEAALGILAFRLSPADYFGGFRTTEGLLGLSGQIGFAVIPWLRREKGAEAPYGAQISPHRLRSLHQPRKEACADRGCLIVEIIAG